MQRFVGITAAIIFIIFGVFASLTEYPWYQVPLVGVGGVAASALLLTVIMLSIAIQATVAAWLISGALYIAALIYLKATGHTKSDIKKIMAQYRDQLDT